ncbi:hypothetical protein AAFF_G00158710 [Aldrovandia affinis]|uniref:Uncharacterized protein n=1 Tax=Aldrovandia affinis TaxID=143900 RepID=A0AAD7RMY3_9TELE|nr:hypothetical protein AAFF_G00158710 [Aldrovandia affinis]
MTQVRSGDRALAQFCRVLARAVAVLRNETERLEHSGSFFTAFEVFQPRTPRVSPTSWARRAHSSADNPTPPRPPSLQSLMDREHFGCTLLLDTFSDARQYKETACCSQMLLFPLAVEEEAALRTYGQGPKITQAETMCAQHFYAPDT